MGSRVFQLGTPGYFLLYGLMLTGKETVLLIFILFC